MYLHFHCIVSSSPIDVHVAVFCHILCFRKAYLSFTFLPVPPAAPSAPSEVLVTDIGPTSVKLEWSSDDDGGAAIDGIRVTLMTFVDETEVDYNVEPGQSSAVIPELMDSQMYRLQLQLRNRIGEISSAQSPPTATPLPQLHVIVCA